MAANDQNRTSMVQDARKAGKQAREAFEFDLKRRLGDQNKILSADDMGGLYDPKRALFTTIDGKPRMLTFDDILAFKAAVKDVQRIHGQHNKQVSGGILVKRVIDLATSEDRERANKQIHFAVPMSNRAGVVQFQTNAGPNSNVSRHTVMVQFLSYDAALSSGQPSHEAAKLLARGKVKYDCDCNRHTFWFRYIASIGNFNYGRAEDGFPRVRNPKLYGIACKHVIRVMGTLGHAGTFNNFARKMIEHGRKTLSNKQRIMTVKEQQAYIDNAASARKRDRTIKTSEEKRAERSAQPAQQRKAVEAAKVRAANDELRRTHASKVNKPVPLDKKIKAMMKLGYSEQAARVAITAADNAQG
ncbi:hypothetical protein WG29040_23150 [Pseudomonas sp. PAMC 29040]|uniref:hypothetical protein n=1 Tax=Pseudomonas sp. PAMC 29040 TaxID=2498450 RepID=UPI000FAD2654|nr:hypothetical protein [Pseudomonas sp. PAMC 29040]RUT30839.1 hypothetical protein WG29040_23150 [Pseudomonas sp. PAMC 29040]